MTSSYLEQPLRSQAQVRKARTAREMPIEPHPLDIAERDDLEDRSAGDPTIEDHAFNPANGSAGDY